MLNLLFLRLCVATDHPPLVAISDNVVMDQLLSSQKEQDLFFQRIEAAHTAFNSILISKTTITKEERDGLLTEIDSIKKILERLMFTAGEKTPRSDISDTLFIGLIGWTKEYQKLQAQLLKQQSH